MKKLIALIFTLTALLCISARAETVGGNCGENGGSNVKWELNTETGELRVFGEGLMADYWSHSMAPWAKYSSTVRSLTIEEGVTTVGINAFCSMEAMESVSLPASLNSIRDYAFAGTPLTSVDIPGGVRRIGCGAFMQTNIRQVTVPEGAELDESVFYYCRELKTAVLPKSLTAVPKGLFKYTGLEEYTIPSNVTKIGVEAFMGCASLKKIKLHEGMTDIGEHAFNGCTTLSSVDWPSTVVAVPDFAFCDCSSLTEITLPEGVEAIGPSAFFGCKGMASVTLPGTLKSISGRAFWGTGIRELNLPNSVTEVGDYAFHCPELRSATLSKNMTSISYGLFYGCEKLEKINLASLDNLAYIGGSAFSGCNSLRELTIPKNVTEISWLAFDDMPGLPAIAVDPENTCFFEDGGVLYSRKGPTLIAYPMGKTDEEYVIPEGVTGIDALAFWKHSHPKRLVLPSTLSDIRADDFRSALAPAEFEVSESNPYFCAVDGVVLSKDKTVLVIYPADKADEEYTVPDRVTEIGANAFAGSYNLRKLTLPDTVTTLGLWTFQNCKNLESVNIPSGVKDLPQDMLTGCPKITRFIVPEGVRWIDAAAFDIDLVNVNLPDSVTELESGVIGGCSTLILPDDLTCNFYNSRAVLLCRSGSAAEAALIELSKSPYRKIYFLPSIIGPGEEPSVVGQIASDRKVVINGVTIPLWRINYSLYVSEKDLARCGYTFSWDPESRITTITAPETVEWTVSETESESNATVDIWSSDVKFVLNGFVIPSLNIGNGESVLDINAVAERNVY
ncbi:MAG: leucine-rich repeat domain-containing protein [Oscillospiraceae bacterium]|nr:leucine-rich repeat domain-containing protein [Oscillospiraceae bacterium]